MKKIFIFIFLFLVFSNHSFALKKIGYNTTMNKDLVIYDDAKIEANFELKNSSLTVNGDLDLGTNSKIDGDLIVKGNLKVGYNVDIGGNLKVGGDIESGANLNVKGSVKGKNILLGSNSNVGNGIISNGYLKGGYNLEILNGVDIKGYLKAESNFYLHGKSKILGDMIIGTNSNIYDTTYIYGDFNKKGKEPYNFDFSGDKLKITKNVYLETNGNLVGRIYVFGDKYTGNLYNEELKNYSGLMGKIDPLLDYKLSEETILSIKNHINTELSKANNIQKQINNEESKIKKDYNKISTLKAQKHKIYVDLFDYLETYIEDEDFDKQHFSVIKKSYTGNYIVSNTGKNFTTNSTSIDYTPFMPNELIVKLDEIFAKFPKNSREKIYKRVISKIDNIVEIYKKKQQTTKIIRMIRLLYGIQEYTKDKLIDLQSDKVLNLNGF